MTEPRRIRQRVVQQLPLLVGLVILWMLLWGEFSWRSSLSGILVAVLVTRVFYLPPVELSGRVNVFWLLVFLVRFAGELVVSSVLVAAQVFRPGRMPLNAIIEVPLRTESDFVMSLTAITISLMPGTLVLEIDRERSLLFLHVLAAGDEAGLEKARRSALAIEASVIRAVGSRDDLARVNA